MAVKCSACGKPSTGVLCDGCSGNRVKAAFARNRPVTVEELRAITGHRPAVFGRDRSPKPKRTRARTPAPVPVPITAAPTVVDGWLRLTLPIRLVNDNGGRSQHWRKADKRKGEYVALVRLLGGRREPFDHPVKIRLTRILGPRERLWDEDSIGRGSAKELIDALVDCRWLVDDSPRWVTSVFFGQEIDRGNGPAVRVEIETGAGSCL